MEIVVSNRQNDKEIDEKYIKDICRLIIDYLNLKNIELSISLISEEESIRLNNKYRKKNKTAEVLSFPTEEIEIIGDVVITPSLVGKTAKRQGVNFRERLVLLLTHSILHLTGRHHDNEQEALETEKIEEGIMQKLKQQGII